MLAARQNVAEIACGCAAHTVFALPVAPQMYRCYDVPSAVQYNITETCREPRYSGNPSTLVHQKKSILQHVKFI